MMAEFLKSMMNHKVQ